MKRNYVRTIIKCMSVLMISILFLTSLSVSASPIEESEEMYPVLSRSVKGKELSGAFKEVLAKEGVYVADGAKVTILNELGGQEKATAVVVNNEDGPTVEQDVLLFVGSKFSIADAVIDDPNQASTMNSSPGDYSSSKFVIHCTASYDYYVNYSTFITYIRPLNTAFSITKKQTCNISYVSEVYNTRGTLCSYPGYSVVSYSYLHKITNTRSNPQANTILRQENALSSSRVLDISTGDIYGMTINLTVTADGKTESYSIPLGV